MFHNHIYVSVCVCLVYFLVCPLKRSRNNDQPSSNEHILHSCLLEILFPTAEARGFFEKSLIPGMGQDRCDKSLD